MLQFDSEGVTCGRAGMACGRTEMQSVQVTGIETVTKISIVFMIVQGG